MWGPAGLAGRLFQRGCPCDLAHSREISRQTYPGAVDDSRGRALRDLRVSVTDRCNFRCPYCMPRELFGPDHAFLPRAELLTFEEIARFVGAAATQGINKIRLTGGEPLVRRDLPDLVAKVAAVRQYGYSYGRQTPAQVPAVMDEIIKMFPGTPMAKVAEEHKQRAAAAATRPVGKPARDAVD